MRNSSVWISGGILAAAIGVIVWNPIKRYVKRLVIDTLRDEEINEEASAVVHRTISHKDTHLKASHFLAKTVNNPQSMDSLRVLLEREEIRVALHGMIVDTLRRVVEDPVSYEHLTTFIKQLLQHPETHFILIDEFRALLMDPALVKMVKDWATDVLTDKEIKDAASNTLTVSAKEAVTNNQFQKIVKNAIIKQLKSDELQKAAGDAGYKSLWYMITPKSLQ